MRQSTLFFPLNNQYLPKLGTSFFVAILLLFSFSGFSQVGINTTSPTTTLDIEGAISLRESPRPLELLNGVNIDISLTGDAPYSQYRIEGPDAAFQINGIKSVFEADGQIVRLVNTTDQIMTIVHNEGSELKIVCPAGKNLIVGGRNSSVTLQYSKGLRKWTVFGYAMSSMNSSKMYSVAATSSIIKSNGTPQDMDGLVLTFTPKNPIVYVTYNIFGDINPGSAEGRFHIIKDGIVVNNTEMRTSSLAGAVPYQGMLPMFPLIVTPGIPTTLKVQWWRGQGTGTINNNPITYPSHGRYITVID